MSRGILRWRPLTVALLAFALLASVVPGKSAQAAGRVDWFGWGVHVDFASNTWSVMYVTYLGRNTATGPQVINSSVIDISGDCTQQGTGTLSYPTPDSAYFDGQTYLECDLPSISQSLSAMGYAPPSGSNPICPCALGGGPFWVDAHVRQLSTTNGTMPLFDASDRGIRSNLIVNGGKVRTQLSVARDLMAIPAVFSTYTGPEKPINPSGNRDVMGWYGRAIVSVADQFGWLNYLTDPNWRTFFTNDVNGNLLGFWHESPTWYGTRAGNAYELGMSSGTLYIGYSPSTGAYFQGELDDGGIEPGCKGS